MYFRNFFLLFFATLLIACSSSKRISESANVEMEGIAFSIERTVYPVSVTAVNVSIWNDTKSLLYVNENYKLEHYSAGEWQGIESDRMFIAVSYSLNPDERKAFTISLPRDQFDFVPGKYRVNKTVFSEEDTFQLKAEFSLE